MKASLFSIIAAAALLTSAASFAATPAAYGPFDHHYEHGPNDRYNDRNSKDFNCRFDKKHRVTTQEHGRWEATQRRDGRR